MRNKIGGYIKVFFEFPHEIEAAKKLVAEYVPPSVDDVRETVHDCPHDHDPLCQRSYIAIYWKINQVE